VELVKLDESKHTVISGEWKKANAGGSHLYSDEFAKGNEASWQINPKYLLTLPGEGKAEVEIVLSRPQWKSSNAVKKEEAKGTQSQGLEKEDNKKKTKTIVGTMMGMYMFENKGQKLLKISDCIEEVTFFPKNEIIYNKTFDCNENGYVLMPCTFEVIWTLIMDNRIVKKELICYL
jgi:hypothetical protein